MSINREIDDFDSQILPKIGELYLKTAKADVYFSIESTGERIPAHKILLSSGSDVFDAMFYGSLKEEGDIKIVDASAEAFKEFLQFFYFNKIKLNIDNVAEVMYIGKKYDVEDCLRLCSKLLSNKITTENVISVLDLAITYDQKQLQKICETEISSHSTQILQLPSFMECNRQTLNHILNMENLSCSEIRVFEACMSWVRVASKQEQLTRDIVNTHLGDLFYAIRFGSMSIREFTNLLPSYDDDFFTATEYNEILKMNFQKEYKPKLFKGFRRSRVWDEDNVIKCNRSHIELISGYNILPEEVTIFSTERTLLLGYFVCQPLYDSGHPVKTAKVMAAIIHIESKRTERKFSFDYAFSSQGFTVKLLEPIIIQKKIKYKIRLTFPSSKYYACRQFNTAVNIGNNTSVWFHNDRNVNDKIVGVICELGFNSLELYDAQSLETS